MTTTDLSAGDFPGLSGSALALARQVPPVRGKDFAAHWAEHFALALGVDETLVAPSPEAILGISAYRPRGSYFIDGDKPNGEDFGYSGFEPEPGKIYAALETRQGGGNRECYCDSDLEDGAEHEDGCLTVSNEELQSHPDHIVDYDHTFDRTYATFIFSTKLTAADLAEFQELSDHIRAAARNRAELQTIESGEATPWSILVEDSSLLVDYIAKIQQLISKHRSRMDDGALRLAETVISLTERVLAGETVPVRATFGNMTGQDLNGKLGITSFAPSNIIDKLLRASAANGEVEDLRAMIAQAEMLPSGSPLHAYLLGDRGQGTYTVQEKQGRRNVPVTKIYDKGSLLGKELEDVERRASSALEDVESYLKPVLESRRALLDAQESVEQFEAHLVELNDERWAAGWPGPLAVPSKP